MKADRFSPPPHRGPAPETVRSGLCERGPDGPNCGRPMVSALMRSRTDDLHPSSPSNLLPPSCAESSGAISPARSTRGADEPLRAQGNGVAELARLGVVAGLQRGYGRGASPSKPNIRATWSHSPHLGGRARRGPGAQHRVRAAHPGGVRAGEGRQRLRQPARAERGLNGRGEPGPLVRGQPPAVVEDGENSPTAWPPPAVPAVAGICRACAEAADGSMDGSLDGSGATGAPRGWAGCTPSARWLHPVPGSGCSRCTPLGQLSTA